MMVLRGGGEPLQQDNVFRLNFNSVVAISIRDMMERYGRSNIGFLWAFVEPLLLAVGVMVVWSVMKSGYEHGISLLTMVFTGYLPLTLWRHITGGAVNLFPGSFALLYHRKVSLADIIVARTVSEFAATTASTLLTYFVLLLFNLVKPIERPDLVIAGWLLMAWLSTCALTMFACICARWPATGRFFAAFQYLLLPISGTFFLLEWLPSSARELISYNPLVHCYEIIREGYFGSQVTTYFTPSYVVISGLVMAIIGVSMMRSVREELSGH
jgi:capsular polysaccharide transport system permease protein